MDRLVDNLFDEPGEFISDWERCEAEVIAGLELVSLAMFAKADVDDVDLWSGFTARFTGKIRNWDIFSETAARLCLETFASSAVLNSHQLFIPSVSSIEVNFLPFHF